MRRIIRNNHGSAVPIVLFIICLGLASLVILLMGHIVEPFMNLLESDDSMINPGISVPRENTSWLIQIIWPKGLLLVIFIGCAVALFMEYQKKQYKEG